MISGTTFLQASYPTSSWTKNVKRQPQFGHGIPEQSSLKQEPARELSRGQKICDAMIAWYQRVTRESRLAEKLNRTQTGLFGCGYKDLGLSSFSCSEYTRAAIRQHGVVKGIWKGFWRIVMCNPLTFRMKSLQKFAIVP